MILERITGGNVMPRYLYHCDNDDKPGMGGVGVQLAEKYKHSSKAQGAAGIVKEMFKDELSPGVIWLRESKYYKACFQLVECLRALKDLFKTG
jgi:hypothetical protein